MRRTELLQETRKMRFTELFEAWQESRLTQQEAGPGAWGYSSRTTRRKSA